MQLRMGLEVEAAGSAAERAQPGRIEAIAAALEAIDRAIRYDELGVMEDFAIHREIAEPLETRSSRASSSSAARSSRARACPPRPRACDCLETIQAERRAIFAAILNGSVGDARRAMRSHLLRSRDRYRRLAPHRPPSRAEA